MYLVLIVRCWDGDERGRFECFLFCVGRDVLLLLSYTKHIMGKNDVLYCYIIIFSLLPTHTRLPGGTYLLSTTNTGACQMPVPKICMLPISTSSVESALFIFAEVEELSVLSLCRRRDHPPQGGNPGMGLIRPLGSCSCEPI